MLFHVFGEEWTEWARIKLAVSFQSTFGTIFLFLVSLILIILIIHILPILIPEETKKLRPYCPLLSLLENLERSLWRCSLVGERVKKRKERKKKAKGEHERKDGEWGFSFALFPTAEPVNRLSRTLPGGDWVTFFPTHNLRIRETWPLANLFWCDLAGKEIWLSTSGSIN